MSSATEDFARELPPGFRDKNICIIGLGYVGMTLAVAMAERGWRVHGIEKRPEVVEALADGKASFWENELDERLAAVVASGRLTGSVYFPDDVDFDTFVISVGTPLDSKGKSRTDMVATSAATVAQIMKDDTLVILRSTVKVGTTRAIVEPILRTTGKRFDVAFCPERTLQGHALAELAKLPQIVGADSKETRDRCAALFSHMTDTIVPVSSLEAAELIKLVDNTSRDVSFAFSNEVATLCTQAGLSAHEVIRKGSFQYPRTSLFLPGPVGGPCLEKDPHILVESAREFGVEFHIASAARHVNETQPSDTVKALRRIMKETGGFPENPRIVLCGLAFKGNPATDDLRGTMALPVRQALGEQIPNAALAGYDPLVPHDMAEERFAFTALNSLEEAFKGADVVMILNNNDQFKSMDITQMSSLMNSPGVIYDFWNMHTENKASLAPGVSYIPLGGEHLKAEMV
ncbi:MAG: UDP-N-acetyl-D-mannosamine dehydrogenase [Rhodospirillales bacterium]